MKKIKMIQICLAAALSCLSIATFAGNRPCATTLSLGEGYYHFACQRNLNDVWVPNLALAYNFNQHWAAEAGAGLINTSTDACCGRHEEGVHGFLYNVDGLYRFTPYCMVEPYIIAGVGALSLKPNGNDSVSQGNVHAGIGSQFFISPCIAFRAEGRDLYTITGGKNDLMLNLGMSFLFGG